MSVDSHILELLPAHALGILDEEEILLVSEHLAVCPACRVEFHSFQEVTGALALATPTAEPPTELKRRLMERSRRHRQPSSFQPHSSGNRLAARIMPVWGVVSLLLILVLAVTTLLLWQRVSQLEVTHEPGSMQAISVAGTEAAPDATGYIVVGADGRNGALVAEGLPSLGSERQYQLWLIHDGQRDSGGVFSVDQDGYGGMRIVAPRSLFEYSAVGVSIEPAGGSPGPTGDRVLGGALFDS